MLKKPGRRKAAFGNISTILVWTGNLCRRSLNFLMASANNLAVLNVHDIDVDYSALIKSYKKLADCEQFVV